MSETDTPNLDRRDLNFLQVWRIQALDRNLAVLEGLAGLSPGSRRRLLRHHDDEPVDDEEEMQLRAALDRVLHAAGVLEVGFAAGALLDVENWATRRLAPLLMLPEVVTYYEQHYHLTLPRMLLERLSQARPAMNLPNRTVWFSRLLALDERFRDEELKAFLSIVDGFDHKGHDFGDLIEAARSGERMVQAVTTSPEERDGVDQALVGLEQFVLFSNDLWSCLQDVEDDGYLQEAAFRLYLYWYKARARALSQVTGDTIAALSGMSQEQVASGPLRCTEALFERALTSAGPELDRRSLDFTRMESEVEPATRLAREQLLAAIAQLSSEDPFFSTRFDELAGTTVLQGLSEDHLAVMIDRLAREHGIEATFGAPVVAYRETLGRRVEIDHTFQVPAGRFARVKLVFEPGERGSGFVFEDALAGAVIPKAFIAGVQRGLEGAKARGLLAGFPVIDFKAILVGGAYSEAQSDLLAFELAAKAAFKQLREKAEPRLLEPVVSLEVATPDDFLGSVIGDLNARRGMIQGMQSLTQTTLLYALVPLALIYDYAGVLRGLTGGRADFRMRSHHYEPVPQHRADEVVSKSA